MKDKIKNLNSHTDGLAALEENRADRAANRARREELNSIVGDYALEMKILEKEYRENDDEDEILRRIGQIAVGE